MNQIFDPSDDPETIAEAVVAHGYAAIEGYQSMAVPCCNKVISALKQYPDVCAVQSFQNVQNRGYLYLVVDTGRFELTGPDLREAIDHLDAESPGGA